MEQLQRYPVDTSPQLVPQISSLLLCPHPVRIPTALSANRGAVANGEVREVVEHGVTLALVAVLAAVILPVRVEDAGDGG